MPPLEQPLDLLAIAPHPDDAEISVGGTLVTCHRQGMRVGVLDLTNGEPTPYGTVEIRAKETAAASEIMQLDWRHNLGLPNRTLEHTIEARRALATVIRLTQPRILLAPYHVDSHPDHVAATSLIEAARFWAKLTRSDMEGEPWHPPHIFYYFSIHLRVHPQPAFVFDISDAIDAKLASVRCYESQFFAGRSQEFPTPLDDIRDRARYWGWSISKKFGEPFASRESIPLGSFKSLIGGGS